MNEVLGAIYFRELKHEEGHCLDFLEANLELDTFFVNLVNALHKDYAYLIRKIIDNEAWLRDEYHKSNQRKLPPF